MAANMTFNNITCLILDDSNIEIHNMRSLLSKLGCRVLSADHLEKAYRLTRMERPDLAFVDYHLAEGTAVDYLRFCQSLEQPPAVYVLSAYGNIPKAVEAVRRGARDFLEKPLEKTAAREILSSLQSQKNFSSELEEGIAKAVVAKNVAAKLGLVCAPDSPMQEKLELAKLVASKNCSILIQGETGTGKEVVAQWIHAWEQPAKIGESIPKGRNESHETRAGNAAKSRIQDGKSSQAERPFISLNCAALPDSLVESELFGHLKGAFTGAVQNYPGKLAAAHGGTLFLDEIGDLPLSAQSKLLRALQEKKVTPLGGLEERPARFRLLSATHKDLDQLVYEGEFREDLLFRLKVIPIELPPLRQRPQDVPLLVKKFFQDLGVPPEEAGALSENLPEVFWDYPWPGNVRELRNAVEQYWVLSQMGKSWEDILPLTKNSLGKQALRKREGSSEWKSFNRLSEARILQALQKCGHHRQKTADFLGISRRTLQYRLAEIEGSS